MTDKTPIEERKKIFEDIYINNVIPERMPIIIGAVSHYILSQYANIDCIDAQFDLNILAEYVDKISDLLKLNDTPIVGTSPRINRNPASLQKVGSKIFCLGETGLLQRPEVEGMSEDEYDELISDPYKLISEKIVPRLYEGLDFNSNANAYTILSEADALCAENCNEFNKEVFAAVDKYGFWMAPKDSAKLSIAPFDYLSDNLRGFSGVCKDIRRNADKVKAAVDKLLPMIMRFSMPDASSGYGKVRTALHMPCYLREKDFAGLYFPSFRKMSEQYAARNIRNSSFCEGNYERLFDYMLDLPAGSELHFEYGDPKKIKDTLGSKFIITGLYPLDILRNGTKQEVLDKAKELLDIMLPGGGYIFEFDKIPLTINDINMDNYIALIEFIHDYARYDNHGNRCAVPALNSENFAKEEINFTSSALFNWEDFKAKYPLTPDSQRIRYENNSEETFRRLITLLI